MDDEDSKGVDEDDNMENRDNNSNVQKRVTISLLHEGIQDDPHDLDDIPSTEEEVDEDDNMVEEEVDEEEVESGEVIVENYNHVDIDYNDDAFKLD